MKARVAVLGTILALLPATATLAQTPTPTVEQHHREGLFLAIEVGYAGHTLSRGAVSVSGRGADVRVAGGGLVTPRVAVFGGYATFESSSVKYTQPGMNAVADEGSIDASSFFAGARTYLPYDLYVDGSVGTLTERFFLGSSSTVGVMGQLAVGKEWRLISGLTLLTELRGGLGSAPRDYGGAVHARHLGLYIGLGYAGD